MTLQFEISVYKDLIERYPDWEDLKKYLESEEGGLFKFTDKDDNGFCLIRYEKGVTNMELSHSKWFRSVVWNIKTNKPVCVAPPKAESCTFPYKSLVEISDAGIICQELLEGFMINVFKVVGDETLHITSRSKLNAAGKFYSDKSFRELFMESYIQTPDYIIPDTDGTPHIISSPDSSKNEVAVFSSFLVQHTEHRIVKNIDKNRVYIIQQGRVYEDGTITIEDTPNIYKNMYVNTIELKQPIVKGSYAQIAAKVKDDCEGQSEVDKWIKNIFLEKGWDFQGIVFKDNSGNRWRFRSEKHSAIKTLRGNSPSIIERFAQLYTQNLISKYLEYYSEDMIPITIYLMFMDTVVKILYDSYVDLHITKEKKSTDINKMFLPHLYSIHGIYLSKLKPDGKKINFDEIKMYLHKQPWQRIVFLIKKIIAEANEES